MKKTFINQVEAIALLKEKKSLSGMEVTFDSTPVEALDAFLLRKNGISVPDELIWYDDDAIDYSDIPEWTDEGIEKSPTHPNDPHRTPAGGGGQDLGQVWASRFPAVTFQLAHRFLQKCKIHSQEEGQEKDVEDPGFTGMRGKNYLFRGNFPQ